MSDKGFQILMGIAVTALVVGMSTPLTGVGLQDLTTRLLHQISATSQAPATDGDSRGPQLTCDLLQRSAG